MIPYRIARHINVMHRVSKYSRSLVGTAISAGSRPPPARVVSQPDDEQAPAARCCPFSNDLSRFHLTCRTAGHGGFDQTLRRYPNFHLICRSPGQPRRGVTDQMKTDRCVRALLCAVLAAAHAASPGSPPPDDTAIKTSLTIYSCRDGNNILSVGWFSFTLIACGRYST